MNANGVPPSSPGLRGTRYPGIPSRHASQPQRGCAPCDVAPANPGGTALRFVIPITRPQGRPHCIRPTLGWRAKSRWDMNHGALDVHLFNANGVQPSSPGLRGTRYPGSSSHPTSQPQRGCVPCDARSTPPGGTALRFNGSRTRPQGRPHCIRPTLGWRAISRWDINHGAWDAHLFNANGVPPSSPGLRGTRYPGITVAHVNRPDANQPHRCCAPNNARSVHAAGTALRFDISRHAPQGRPHCIRPTLGWRAISRWDMNHGALDFHLFNTNGVAPSLSVIGSLDRIHQYPS